MNHVVPPELIGEPSPANFAAAVLTSGMPPDTWLSTTDAAALIGCVPRQVRLLCGQGKLVSRKGAKRGRGHDLEVTQASAEVWAKRKGKGRPRSVLDGFIVRR